MTPPLCPTLCINRQKHMCMITTTCGSSKMIGAPDTLFPGKDKSRVHEHKVATTEIPSAGRIQQRHRLRSEREGRLTAFPTAAELRGDSYLKNNWEEDEEETDLSDSLAAEEGPPQDSPPRSHPNSSSLGSALAVGEGLCLTAALLSVLRSVVQAWKSHARVSPSPSLPFLLPSASLWHIIPLLLALLLKFFNSSRTTTATATAGPHATRGRVPLEEEALGSAVRSVGQVVRAVEKLGVRFRVTKRALRDSARETGALAEQTAQIVEVLALRAERLEAELQETQKLILAMQDQSARQLALFSETTTESRRVQRELLHKVALLQPHQKTKTKMETGGESNATKGPPLNASPTIGPMPP